MKVFHSKLLWKYFASYFCFLMLPLCGLGIFVFHYFSSYLQRDVIVNNRNMVEQIQNIGDSQYQSIKDIAFQISADPDLTPYKIKSNATTPKQSLTALRRIKAPIALFTSFSCTCIMIHLYILRTVLIRRSAC